MIKRTSKKGKPTMMKCEFHQEAFENLKENIKEIKDNQKAMDEKLDDLISFKAKIIGVLAIISIAASGVFTFLANVIAGTFKGH